MTARRAPAWQVIIADLSLILFLTSLIGIGRPEEVSDVPGEGPQQSYFAEGQLLYRPTKGALEFERWLREIAPDSRMQVTIYMGYRDEIDMAALEQARGWLGQARSQGYKARIVVEQTEVAELYTLIAYDQAAMGSRAVEGE
jgi:hypothetical protein